MGSVRASPTRAYLAPGLGTGYGGCKAEAERVAVCGKAASDSLQVNPHKLAPAKPGAHVVLVVNRNIATFSFTFRGGELITTAGLWWH